MALSSSQLLSFTQSLTGISSPSGAVDLLLGLFEAEGLYPVSWADMSKVLRGVYTNPLPREFGSHFDSVMDKSGERGFYIRKGAGPAPERAPVAPRAPRASRSEGLSWSPAFIAPDQERESWYGEDAGLRRIALGQVKCFGSHSEQDRACGTCPLARFCQEASLAKMDELARLLDTQEEARILQETEALNAPPAPEVPVTPEAPAPSVTPVSQTPPASQTVPWILAALQVKGMTASSPPMPFKGVCSGCSETVEAGSTVIHVKGRGMFHPDCAQKL